MLTMSRYSQSKATALVVDIGALNTSVTALWDGMVLQKSKSLVSPSFAFFISVAIMLTNLQACNIHLSPATG